MKLKLILASAVALVTAAPANAAYFKVDFQTQGEGVRTYVEQRDTIPYYSFMNIKNITFSVLVPEENFFADDNFSIAYGYGFDVSSNRNGVSASGDSSAASGVPDYRYGFDFSFGAFFDNAPGGMIPLGYTSATGNAFLSAFSSSPRGDGFNDRYTGRVTSLRVNLIEGSTFGTSFVYSVPELSTWALMLVGFGLMGGALRYGRKRTTVAYA